MAENFTPEIYNCEEWTVPCTVPLYWNDLDVWNDDAPNTETIEVRGIFTKDYIKLDLGIADQDSTDPQVRIQTAEIPNAAEGDSVIVDGTAYKVGTPKPNGRGDTLIDLYLAEFDPATVTAIALAGAETIGINAEDYERIDDLFEHYRFHSPTTEASVWFNETYWIIGATVGAYEAFTNTTTNTDSPLLPPKTGWEPAEYGSAPAPALTYNP